MTKHVEIMLKKTKVIKDFSNKILSIFASRGPIKILVIKLLVDLKTCN